MQANGTTLVAMQHTVLQSSQAAQLRYSICSGVHGADSQWLGRAYGT
jgi:hypothetical protein